MIGFNRLVLLTCSVFLIPAPASYGATDKANTPAIAAYQATKGAFKLDRKISRHILRSEHKKESSEPVYTR